MKKKDRPALFSALSWFSLITGIGAMIVLGFWMLGNR